MSVEVGIDEIVVEVSVPVVDVTVDVSSPAVDVISGEPPLVEIGIQDAVVSVDVSTPSVTVEVVDAAVDVILSGPPGKEGTIILNGDTPPTPDLGLDGYYYLDTFRDVLYGPKTADIWPIALDPPGEVLEHEFKPDPHPQYLDKVPNYVHYQATLSKTWTVTHSMGKHPVVVVEDSAGSTIYGTITYLDLNQLTITFMFNMTGFASCT